MITLPRRDTSRSAEAWFGQFWKLLVRLAVLAFAAYFVWRGHMEDTLNSLPLY